MKSLDKQTELTLTKLNSALKDNAIFYLSNDPERALGLEQLIDNYNIVFIDKSQYLDRFKLLGINYFCLEEELGEQNTMFRSSLKLIKHGLFNRYFNTHKKRQNFVQTFKISPAFAKVVEELGAISLNSKPELNRLFENKLSQYQELRSIGAMMPSTEIVKLADTDFGDLQKQLGERLVVQFDRGHTGESTFFINSKEEYASIALQFPHRTARIATFIDGKTYTLNACATRKGTFMGGLSYQITGPEALTDSPAATVGNDFLSREDLSEGNVAEVVETVTRIGDYMYSKSYQGLFGVDFVISEGKPYFIEINARQPASVPFHTKLQLLSGQVPLSLIHIMEFLGLVLDIEPASYNDPAMLPLPYAQVFLRAKSATKIIAKVKQGVYRLLSDNTAVNRLNDEVLINTLFLDEERDKPLVYQKEAYSITEIKGREGMLVLAPVEGREVKKGGELARIQVPNTVVDRGGVLYPWVVEALSAIKNYLL